jgi:hypothetical protein
MAIGPWGLTPSGSPGMTPIPGELPLELQGYVQREGLDDGSEPQVGDGPGPMQMGTSQNIRDKAKAARAKLEAGEPPEWQDPLGLTTPGVTAPTPTSAGGVNPGGVGDFGLGAIQNRLKAEENKPVVPGEVTGEIDSQYAKRKSAADQYGTDAGRIEGQMLGLATTQATLIKTQHDALASAEEKMQKASLLAQYPSLSGDEIDRQTEIINDSSGKYNDNQKRAAQLTLKRASSIDPTRLLSTSTSNKVLAVVAQALGTLGTGMTHGRLPNYGMQLVQEAIDRDIMAQKSAFEQADRGYQRQRTLYSDLRARFSDEQQTIAAQRSMLMGVASQMAEKYKANDLAMQLNIEAQKFKGQVAQAEEAHRLDALSKEALIARERQQGALENKKLDIIASKSAAQGNGWAPGGIEFEPGFKPPPKGPPLNKLTGIAAEYNSLKPLLNDLIQARGKYGAEIFNRYGVTDMQSLHSLLFDQLRKYVKTGAHLSPDEKVNIERMISSDPSNIGFVLTKLQATKRAIESSVNGELSTYHAHLPDQASDEQMSAPTPGEH